MAETTLEVPRYRQRRSVSQLTGFVRCGEAYRLEKAARAPARPAAWFMMGTAVHGAIEHYELNHRAASADEIGQLAVLEYDQLIDDAMEREPNPARWLTGGNKKGENDIRDRRIRTGEYAEAYVRFAEAHSEEWRILQLGDQPAVELEFTVDFGGVQVLGYIDQVRHYRDGRIEPVDIKTGSRKQDSSFQLAIYAHAINANLGVLPIVGSFWEAKHEADSTMPLGGWSKELLDDMFSRFDQAERQALYVPNPGDACRTCPVADYCRVNGVPDLASEYAGTFERV
ncbi:RecB family exonuclease [Brevibacterium album]|uniref:RecB family exonuclease n=1 Tax=Brevibacterium album TaxID=417948 RepID=UPI00042384BF|nr:PD-(D/E)XK nuclease family protein [Brevibacterium album]